MLGYKELIRKYKINNLVETEHIIEKQRMIKDQEEISSLEKACEITDNCFQYILTYIKPGMTERQIADEIEEYYKKRTEGLPLLFLSRTFKILSYTSACRTIPIPMGYGPVCTPIVAPI